MSTTTTTPIIENVKAQQATMRLYVDMNLAGIPVTVIGQYNIDSNCFYPSTIFPTLDIKDGDRTILATGKSHDLEDACEALGWDYYDTHDAIQQAVENRDR